MLDVLLKRETEFVVNLMGIVFMGIVFRGLGIYGANNLKKKNVDHQHWDLSRKIHLKNSLKFE